MLKKSFENDERSRRVIKMGENYFLHPHLLNSSKCIIKRGLNFQKSKMPHKLLILIF